jgi:phage tail sheath protein FI
VVEALTSSIALDELAPAGSQGAIERATTAVTAFIGRALKGPLNEPVEIGSVAEYQKVFGGLWQPSTLSYAVEQFFENGGRRAIVVRVVNGGRPPSITLPADGGGALQLVGLSPGSREHLRASVDYDGIPETEDDRFNLVLQRVGGPGSGLVEEQEIHRRVSVRPDAGRYVVDQLAQSKLARVVGAPPARRPERPPPSTPGGSVGYRVANNDGDDGAPRTDYDVIGSAHDGTGLFALARAPGFDLLCIPPLGRDHDVGASTLLVAARFCRERQAMLVVDPPREWMTPAEALAGMRQWPFRADNALMFFPRIVAADRLRGRDETFGCGAAVAGMLARMDESAPPWSPVERDAVLLRPRLRPACAVSEAERQRLLQAGLNTLAATRLAHREPGTARTLATGNSVASDWRYLPARRLALCLVQSILDGTRWMLMAHNGERSWRRARAQVEAFLETFAQEGAFHVPEGQQPYFVVCDARLNDAQALAEGRVSLLFGYAASKPGEYHAFVVTHRTGASQVRSATVNRLATSGLRVEEEIETALLRGLASI